MKKAWPVDLMFVLRPSLGRRVRVELDGVKVFELGIVEEQLPEIELVLTLEFGFLGKNLASALVSGTSAN